MVNKSKKGASKELLARKELESAGWTCAFKSQRVRFGRIDFANLFDLVMVAEQSHWYFCAVTHYKAKNTAEERLRIAGFKAKYGTADNRPTGMGTMQFWQWIWHPPAWRGRAAKKHFEQAKWEKIVV